MLLGGRHVVRVHEHVDVQPLDGAGIVIELMMLVEPHLARVLQPVKRRLACERNFRFVERGHDRQVEAQRVMVDRFP